MSEVWASDKFVDGTRPGWMVVSLVPCRCYWNNFQAVKYMHSPVYDGNDLEGV